jgi:predicted SAM-dependent methyltransferase
LARIARILKRSLFRSRPGLWAARAALRLLEGEVLAERTAGLARFDLVRLDARLSGPAGPVEPAETKLHFGCGRRQVPGWLNVDVAGSSCRVDLGSGRLPWADRSFDAIVGQHVIEHLELMEEVIPLLRELGRVSRPGAEVWLSCPDMEKACRSYVERRGEDMLDDFIGRFPGLVAWKDHPSHMINALFHQHGEHKNLFDFDLLRWACEEAGLSDCIRVEEADLLARFRGFPPRNDDFHSIYVRAIARKADLSGELEAIGPRVATTRGGLATCR